MPTYRSRLLPLPMMSQPPAFQKPRCVGYDARLWIAKTAYGPASNALFGADRRAGALARQLLVEM